MLPPAPTCCPRALHRQLNATSDSLWVSDKILGHVYQRFFAVSKTRKRYGSFVPGPLESRRRMGKRRMTLQSEAVSSPSIGLGALWGSFDEVVRTRWHWEAPTTPESRTKEVSSALPKWLVEWSTTAEGSATEPRSKNLSGDSVTFTNSKKASKKISNKVVYDEIESFREAITSCSPEERSTLCYDFNHNLKQSLIAGVHSQDAIVYYSIRTKKIIRDACLGSNAEADRYLSALYQAIWDGISTCKIMRPSDLTGSLTANVLTGLSEVSMCEEVQTLASKIMSSLTSRQQLQVRSKILRLVTLWIESWSNNESLGSQEQYLSLASQAVLDAQRTVHDLRALLRTINRRSSLQDFVLLHEAVQSARESIYRNVETIDELSNLMTPHQRSITTLANTIGHLSSNLIRKIITRCSRHILQTRSTSEMRSLWLSVIARIPNADEELILTTWRRFQLIAEIEEHVACDIILDLWICQKSFERPALVKLFLDVAASQTTRRDYSNLILAVSNARQRCWVMTRSLFRFLEKLGLHNSIYHTIHRMKKLGMKLPADVIDETLENMTAHDYMLAEQTYRLYRRMRANERSLRLDVCPNFVFAMVKNSGNPGDSGLKPRSIWSSIGIPLYESMPTSSLALYAPIDPRRPSSLTPTMVGHIVKMATMFAYSEQHSQRCAVRNVMQCLFHLRRHHVPVPPELTRAITHAGITRKILSRGWVARERVKWILRLIEQAEGTDVAMTVDKLVAAWNQGVSDRVSLRDTNIVKESNPLRVGPID
ncbi:hypothetical protein BUE80_DR004464 [Diplocarpon rosae]|nr:hypothetical protein BUE80_DR004464 [Diplocarpon rosae]